MNRSELLKKIISHSEPFDLAVVGGGATGAAIAMDAASRGFAVVLLEKHDFGKGTSSRSTKLIHGGVRYLEQGNLVLVRDALLERSLLLKNANHLVHDLEFVLPCRNFGELCYFGLGLKLYDLLAGSRDFGKSKSLSKMEIEQRVPTLNPAAYRSGLAYHDGQFNDSRLVINFIQTAVEHGALAINYAPVVALSKDPLGKINGLRFRDEETGNEQEIRARTIINAAGPFGDDVRRLDSPNIRPLLAASQGIHLVLPNRYLPGTTAVIVPRTRDGRVMFLIPWHGQTLVGTTDTPLSTVTAEPCALQEEIDFLLSTASQYLSITPRLDDVQSVFVGIRPLVLSGSGKRAKTSRISRDHVVHVAESNLITIAGGKWTTVRKMAEDAVNRAIRVGHLPAKPCVTRELMIHGAGASRSSNSDLAYYGSDGVQIDLLAGGAADAHVRMHPDLPLTVAQVQWSVRQEMARTIEDVLSRRTRSLILNARATESVAEQVASVVARELGRDVHWEQAQCEHFLKLLRVYKLPTC